MVERLKPRRGSGMVGTPVFRGLPSGRPVLAWGREKFRCSAFRLDASRWADHRGSRRRWHTASGRADDRALAVSTGKCKRLRLLRLPSRGERPRAARDGSALSCAMDLVMASSARFWLPRTQMSHIAEGGNKASFFSSRKGSEQISGRRLQKW